MSTSARWPADISEEVAKKKQVEVGVDADAGTATDCDAFRFTTQGKVDHKARKALEEEGHTLFKAGKLGPAEEEALRAQLRVACCGLDYEVAISWLALTSPTGRYGDNPEVLELFR